MVKENLELGLDCRWSDLKNLVQCDFFPFDYYFDNPI